MGEDQKVRMERQVRKLAEVRAAIERIKAEAADRLEKPEEGQTQEEQDQG